MEKTLTTEAPFPTTEAPSVTTDASAARFPEHLPAALTEIMQGHGCVPDALYAKLGMEVTEASAERVAGSMPVAGNTQPYSMLHGGASLAFAETLASIGAVLHAGPSRVAYGAEVSATHHRAARSGTVHGEAVALHRGLGSVTYDVAIRDDKGRRLCSARVTCGVRQR
ncbi:hotdog fold thioesterase [Streptomyces luteireticuli]|uniref:Thioesterase domain-containing protein n=1 Tax=Streptomyces luteireticuli TaxID=173858 RepID=A0ABP3ICG3_9ACTN